MKERACSEEERIRIHHSILSNLRLSGMCLTTEQEEELWKLAVIHEFTEEDIHRIANLGLEKT